LKGVLVIVKIDSLATEVILESMKLNNYLPRPDTLSRITVSSGITNGGLAFRLCGAIGVITKLLHQELILDRHNLGVTSKIQFGILDHVKRFKYSSFKKIINCNH
jgi:hypothetical protein